MNSSFRHSLQGGLLSLALIGQGCSDQREPAPAANPAAIPNDSGAAQTPVPAAPTGEAAVPATPTAAGSGTTGDGASTYQAMCATCHGASGAGDGPAATALNPKPASFVTGSFRLDPNGNGTKGEIEDIEAVVRDGAAKYGGSPLMAPWPLSPDQLRAVANHVKSLASG